MSIETMPVGAAEALTERGSELARQFESTPGADEMLAALAETI